MDLRRGEIDLRRYDRALRLRESMEEPVICIERKTFRGRIGAHGPGGLVWRPDAGRRREEGHVLVGTVPLGLFDASALLAALRRADSWQRWDAKAKPLWRRVEEAEESARIRKQLARKDGIWTKTNDFYDSFVWRMKSRVTVPTQIR